jgi:hypothetical protein
MTQSLLTKLTLITTIVLQFLILMLLIRRHLNRRFFWFLLYTFFQICEAAVLFYVSGDFVLNWKVYWTTNVAEMAFQIAAFRESFLNALGPYTRLRWFFRAVSLCVGLGLAYAAFRAWYLPPFEAPHRGVSAIVNLNVAVDYSLSIVGILYLALVVFLRIREHRWESAIVLGFTVVCVVSSFSYVPFFKIRFGLLGRWFPPFGFLLGATIWTVGLWRPEPTVAAPVKNLHEKDLELLNRYATIMDLILKRKR